MKMTLKKLLKNQEFPKELFDKNGNQIYWENSQGIIIDKRPKEVKRLTHKEICELIEYNVKIIKEKE